MTSPFRPHAEIHSGDLPLAVSPASAGAARQFTQARLREWRLDHIADTAVLIASELAANAIAAAATAQGDAGFRVAQDGVLILLRLGIAGGNLVIEVWDAAPRIPARQHPRQLDEAGRGLNLVHALAAAWGHYLCPQGGKVVWANVPVPGLAATTVRAPCPDLAAGVPAAQGTGQVGTVCDLQTLRRIRDGLRDLRDVDRRVPLRHRGAPEQLLIGRP